MVAIWTFKQVLMLSGLLFCSISDGYIFGQMSGMLEALYSGRDGTGFSNDDISWIASSINISSVCGFALAVITTEKIGRKRSFPLFSIPIVINWVMLYYADQMLIFMISRILVGISFGGILSMNIISTAEYTSPKIRGLFLMLVTSVCPAVGTALGHVFGLIYHWKTVALLGIIPTALGGVLPLFSEESPSWLASKGRFEDCDKAFRRLHGENGDEVELQVLKEVESKKRIVKDSSSAYVFEKFLGAWKKKYFLKVLLLSSVIHVYLAAAGKHVYSTLAVTMIENITGSKNVLLYTIFVDVFVILGALLSCILVGKLKMRTLLFSMGLIANILLLFLSLFIYFYPEKEEYYAWVKCVTLALYFIAVNAGPYPVLGTVVGEIFPLEFKAYCFFLSGIVLSIAMFVSVKLADFLFKTLGYHGTFLLNTSIMSVCLLYFSFILPETKGRTLQEIELYFKNSTFDEVEKILNGEEVKVLV